MNTKHFKTLTLEREAPLTAQTQSRLEIKLDGVIRLMDVIINANRQIEFGK